MADNRKPELMSLDEAVDREWARTADELEWGAEFTTEWGVRYTGDAGSHIGMVGEEEAEARRWAAREFGTPDVTRTVVARRVITGPWQDRPGVT